MKKRAIFILLLAIILGVITRHYHLGLAPAGLYLDEAAQGYSAYSILKTGKDEFGLPFPIVFRSFADFKTPVYIYLIVPLIPIFGLSAFTVRLPSFLSSILTLPILFLLIQKLTSGKQSGYWLSSLSVLLLSLSPWHILFGRTNFECNVALLIYLLGIYLFYLGLKKPLLLIFSGVVLAVALPAYHSERLLVPLSALFFLVRFNKVLLKPTHLRFALTGLLLAFLITLPLLTIALTPGFLARVNTLAIDPAQNLPGVITGLSGLPNSALNSGFFLRLKDFLALYLAYLSPRNLFFLGDSGPRSSFPDLSTFFFWQLPFYLHGFYLLLKKKDLGEIRNLTLFMLFVSPIPAALTRDPFSTIRALPLVIPVTILISLSLIDIWQRLKTSLRRLLGLAVFGLLLIYSLLKLYSSAIILNEYYRAADWNYGWQQVVEVINKNTDSTLPIVIDNVRTEPYSQVLFFTKFDPARYQRENFEVPLSEYYTNLTRQTTKKIGRISLRGIAWEADLAVKQYLIGDFLAISPEQISNNHLRLIAEIKYPDGSVAFRITLTQPELNSATIK